MTLQEQVNEIIASNKTLAEKRNELLSIGLTQIDLFSMGLVGRTRRYTRRRVEVATVQPANTVTPIEVVSNALENLPFTTIGVEIECFANRNTILSNARNNGITINSESYNHNDVTTHYKLVADGSLRGGRCEGVECVSPITPTSDLITLEKVCKSLEQSGATINRTCGLHVHVNASSLSFEGYKNVFYNYSAMQNVINTFMPASRRCAYYAQPLSNSHFTNIEASSNHNEIACRIGNRYLVVNPMSYTRHKTIEFRQHSGTIEFEKIHMWVRFCVKLVEWSKNNRLTNEIAEINEIPFMNDLEKEYFTSRKQKLSRVTTA